MKNAKMRRSFRLFGALVLTLALGATLVGCNMGTLIGGGIGGLLGLITGNGGSGFFWFGIISAIIGTYIVWLVRETGGFGRYTAHSSSYTTSEGADDLFIELNNGSTLTIKDDYIWGPDGYRLGFINGSEVHSRGRQIGTIKGNGVYDLAGNLICHIENGCLLKR